MARLVWICYEEMNYSEGSHPPVVEPQPAERKNVDFRLLSLKGTMGNDPQANEEEIAN